MSELGTWEMFCERENAFPLMLAILRKFEGEVGEVDRYKVKITRKRKRDFTRVSNKKQFDKVVITSTFTGRHWNYPFSTF